MRKHYASREIHSLHATRPIERARLRSESLARKYGVCRAEEMPAGAAFFSLRCAVARRRGLQRATWSTVRHTLRAVVTAHDRSTAMRRRRRAGGKIRIGGGHGLPPPRRGAAQRQPAMVNLTARRCDSMSPDRSDGVAWRGVFHDQTRELVLFILLLLLIPDDAYRDDERRTPNTNPRHRVRTSQDQNVVECHER